MSTGVRVRIRLSMKNSWNGVEGELQPWAGKIEYTARVDVDSVPANIKRGNKHNRFAVHVDNLRIVDFGPAWGDPS